MSTIKEHLLNLRLFLLNGVKRRGIVLPKPIEDKYDLSALDIILNESSLFNVRLNKAILTLIRIQSRRKVQEWLVNESEDVRVIAQSILNKSTQGEHSNP